MRMMIVTDEKIEKDDDESVVVLCMTVQMGNWMPNAVSPNSIKKPCDNCGISIWVSKFTQDFLLREPTTKCVCSSCLKNIKDSSECLFSGTTEKANEFAKKEKS
jgi:hypothetical protein